VIFVDGKIFSDILSTYKKGTLRKKRDLLDLALAGCGCVEEEDGVTD